MPRLDRRDAALRASIAANLDLIDVLRAKNPSSQEAEVLALHVRAQVHSLIQRQEAHLRRNPMRWKNVFLAAAVAAVTGLALYAMWRPQHWLTWVPFVLVAGIGLLIFLGVLTDTGDATDPDAPEPILVRDGPFVDLRHRRTQTRSETTVTADP
jgi:hypothetical protein